MTLSHPNMYQALECFGVGLLVIAAFVVLFMVLLLVGNRIEGPFDVWCLRHPRVAKFGRWAGAVTVIVIVCFAIFAMGCAVEGAP